MTQILSPVGRLVMGHCFNEFKSDEPKYVKNGPNAGQLRKQFFIGLAVSKLNPGCMTLIKTIMDTAKEAWPDQFDEKGKPKREDFAHKMIDGDSKKPNTEGKVPCERPGFPGCYVFRFTSGYVPRVYNAKKELITDIDAIKRGYFIRVSGTVRGNSSSKRPGVYLNHNEIQLIGYGEEIVSESSKNHGKAFEVEPDYLPPEMTNEPTWLTEDPYEKAIKEATNVSNPNGLTKEEMMMASFL